jgi:hypothetical protein
MPRAAQVHILPLTASLWLHKLDKVCQMLCGACVKEAEEATATGHRKVWEELPGFCDLPPWGELKNEL